MTDSPDSQETLPSWLPERLERARRTAIEELLADLGYSDTESLRATLTAHAGWQTERADLLSQAETARTAQHTALIEAAFQVESRNFPFYDREEVRRLMDFSAVGLDENGQVVGVREAIEALAIAKPHLLHRPTPPYSEAAAISQESPAPSSTLDPEQIEAIKRRFKLW